MIDAVGDPSTLLAPLGTFAGVSATGKCVGGLFSATGELTLTTPTGVWIDVTGVTFGNSSVEPIQTYGGTSVTVTNQGGAGGGVSLLITTYDGPITGARNQLAAVKLDLQYLVALLPTEPPTVICHFSGVATATTAE